MKVLSLFDGMACGMIAMRLAGIEIESYDAYEIDKYAIKTAQHNFPMIREHGDVFDADFTQYEGADFLIGGSPCTYWSIAQTKNRETVASGIGWELFSQYVRALRESKPKYFIYENNKSMSKAIRASIDETFGFEAVLINSALVSAQNRQRLYWVGKRNEDDTYSKVNVEQPADRGILLKDVLDNAVAMREKAHAVIASAGRTTEREFFTKNQGNMVAEPINVESYEISHTCDFNVTPSGTLRVAYTDKSESQGYRVYCADYKSVAMRAQGNGRGAELVAEPINVTADGKSQTLKAQYTKNNVDNFCCYTSTYGASGVAEPVCVAERGRMYCGQPQHYEARTDGKTNTLTSVEKDNRVAEPVGIKHLGSLYGQHSRWGVFDEEGKAPTLTASAGMGGGHLPMVKEAVQVGAKTGLYAIPYSIEFDDEGKPINAINADGKKITIYEVHDGKITIKGKQYPIKLKDGYYIIRKLTVSECKRLQTVPEWYEFPVSDSQAYKMLGNGWTCEVIAHILKYLKES